METLPWWAWKRRNERRTFLERVARTELRISTGGVAQVATSFEQAYLMARYGGNAEHVAGIAFLDLAKMSNCDSGQELVISLRMPIDVAL
jgi:hypothetical protein